MKTCYFLSFLLTAGMALAGCSSHNNEPDTPTPPDKPQGEALPISIGCQTGIWAEGNSRATDTGFAADDAIGLYIVNYQDGREGTLQATGNHADNRRFTYDGTWKPDTPLYWTDNITPADFYLYYPYDAKVRTSDYVFSVKADQRTEADYRASDFLWGKASGIKPTEEAVAITARHAFCHVRIKAEAGNGFTAETLAGALTDIRINGLRTTAQINLADGTATATGDAQNVRPLKTDALAFEAIVVPQSIVAQGAVSLTVGGKEYALVHDGNLDFKAGRQTTLPITLKKTGSGVNVDIGSWEDDGTDQGGDAE